MPTPYAHDHSPPVGERDSPGLNPRDGGEGSHGLTAGEQSPAVPGTPARLGRQTLLHADAGLSKCRDVPGRRPHDTHLLAQHASRKDK